MNLKEIFDGAENGALTHEQFTAACKEAGIKLADLSTGDYVAKKKFEDELAAKDSQIATLNETITARDNDLAGLKTQLEEAGNDATKLTELSNNLTSLQGKYDEDVKNYKAQLAKQKYEFAVKEFANSKNFTSKAAKRDFINSMMSKELTMDGDTIMGADDFVTAYSADNEDAFVIDDPEPKEPETPTPKFVDSTPGSDVNNDPTGGFNFSFTGVRTHD